MIDREGVITVLSVMTGKGERYFERMDDEELLEAYDRMMNTEEKA